MFVRASQFALAQRLSEYFGPVKAFAVAAAADSPGGVPDGSVRLLDLGDDIVAADNVTAAGTTRLVVNFGQQPVADPDRSPAADLERDRCCGWWVGPSRRPSPRLCRLASDCLTGHTAGSKTCTDARPDQLLVMHETAVCEVGHDLSAFAVPSEMRRISHQQNFGQPVPGDLALRWSRASR